MRRGREYLPQARATGGQAQDDALGLDAWLIARSDLARAPLAPFAADIGAWFDAHGVDALVLRPDRHVFGAGEALALQAAWTKLAGGIGLRRVWVRPHGAESASPDFVRLASPERLGPCQWSGAT